MTEIADRASTLTGKYIDGCVSEDELRELEAIMADHHDARVAFLNEMHLHARLGMITGDLHRRPQKTLSGLKQTSRRPSRVLRWVLPMAAALAMITGVYFWSVSPWTRTGMATITGITGEPMIQRGMRHMACSNGMEIRRNDWIITEEGGEARLAFVEEHTRITVTEKARVQLRRTHAGTRLGQTQGGLRIDVAKQPPGKPFVVETQQASIEVLGTRLRSSVSTAATTVSVQKGLVKLTRLFDGKSVEVGAGQHAVAGLDAASSYRPGEEGSPGRVLRQFKVPDEIANPRGIAFDGSTLWVSDDRTKRLYRLDPGDGHIVGGLDVAFLRGSSTRLAWDGDRLWMTDAEKIRAIDTQSGKVIRTFPAVPGGENGGGKLIHGLAVTDGVVWVGGMGVARKLDAKTGRLLEVIQTGSSDRPRWTWLNGTLWAVRNNFDLRRLDGSLRSCHRLLVDLDDHGGVGVCRALSNDQHHALWVLWRWRMTDATAKNTRIFMISLIDTGEREWE